MIKKNIFIEPDIEEYARKNTTRESTEAELITNATLNELDYPDMLSGSVEGRLLAMLVAFSGAKKILELGTFTGYSALSMAEALPEDGTLTTIEMNDVYAEIATRHFALSPHGHKIQLLFGTVRSILPTLDKTYDMIFLDADKSSYPEYYDMLIPRLRSNGILVVDNVLWYGNVLNPEDKKSSAIDAFNQKVTNDDRVENVLLTIRDGIQLIRKL